MAKLISRFIALVAVCAVPILAGPITLSGGYWYPTPTCTVAPSCYTNPARPYWQNFSQDDGVKPIIPGQPRPLASIINGTSPYNASIGTFGSANWFGASDGQSAISNMVFTGAGPFDVSLLVRETGNALILGWYGIDSSGQPAMGGVLIDPGTRTITAGGSAIRFTPTTPNWGLFLKYGTPECASQDWRAVCSGTVLQRAGGNGVPIDIYYSQAGYNPTSFSSSSLNNWISALGLTDAQKQALSTAVLEAAYDPARQHFVAIDTTRGLVIGVEDSWTHLAQFTTLNTSAGPIWEQQGDYNDLVFLINAVQPPVVNPVPEPSTGVLVLIGAVAGWYHIRRRRVV